jgi:hypothetical protein
MDYQSNSHANNSDLFGFSGDISRPENREIEAKRPPLFAKRSLKPEGMDVIEAAVQNDAVARRISGKGIMPEPSEAVGVRLNCERAQKHWSGGPQHTQGNVQGWA